jgi:hypothetical protein
VRAIIIRMMKRKCLPSRRGSTSGAAAVPDRKRRLDSYMLILAIYTF